MKKVLLLAVAGVFVLASCTKDRTCECKENATTTTKTTVNGVTKEFMQVEAECVSSESTVTYTDPKTNKIEVEITKRECELK